MTNLVEVNFLDVPFNLKNASYCPYKKPNDELKHIIVLSSHPPQILKQLTTMISDRLSRNSSSKLIFNEAKHQHEDVLSKMGFKTELTCKGSTTPTTKRKRKIILFNPLYNQTLSTNIAKIFLKLVDKLFPRTHRLHKIFNCNTVKVSCSCMSNVLQLIKKHNNFIQNKKNKTALSCNCRDKNGCPLTGNCRTENFIYKFISLTKNNVKKVYLGVSEGEFKKNRYYNHQQSFQNEDYKNSTTVSTHPWNIKSTSEEQNVNLSWEIMRQAASYSKISERCLLCLHEKLAIALYPNPEELLNKRSEMISRCRHVSKFLLMNFNLNDKTCP